MVDTDDDGLNDKGSTRQNQILGCPIQIWMASWTAKKWMRTAIHCTTLLSLRWFVQGVGPTEVLQRRPGAFWYRVGEGKVMPNIELIDQFDVAFNLHQLYGYYILLDFSWLVWPVPQRCHHAQELFEDLRVGLMVVHVLLDTNSQASARLRSCNLGRMTTNSLFLFVQKKTPHQYSTPSMRVRRWVSHLWCCSPTKWSSTAPMAVRLTASPLKR